MGGGSVVQDKFEENLASSKFIAELLKIRYRASGVDQEGLHSLALTGVYYRVQRSSKKWQGKIEAAAKLCIAKQDQ